MTLEELKSRLEQNQPITGEALHSFMRHYNLSWEYMQDLLGVKRVTFGKWLSGENPPSSQHFWGLVAKFPATLEASAGYDPKVASVRYVYPDGQEARYAKGVYTRWPGCSEPLGKQGFWVGTKESQDFLGNSKFNKAGFKHA